MAAPLLELDNVEARYGPVKALHGVTLEVGDGEVVALLGANGAGKTTTLRAVSNTVRKTGEIAFAGRRITRRSPETIARLGIAHVPEGRGVFGELTVREIFAILSALNEQQGLTVLVVEQNASLALRASHRAAVLEVGRIVLSGESEALQQHDSVRKSYLGY